MDDFKSLFASRTFWGIAVTIIAMVLKLFGFDLDADGQGVLTDAALNLFAVGGSLFALYGRVKATKTIGKK